MRFLMMAVLTVFMGTTLTSCLDSGDSRQMYAKSVTISDGFLGGLSVVSDDGFTLNVTNSSAMSGTLDGETFTPKRALMYYYLAEGETIEENKTQYKVEFAGYGFYAEAVKDFNYEALDTETKVYINTDRWLNFGNGYLDVAFITPRLKDYTNNDIKLCVVGVDGQTIKMKMMNSVEIEDNDNNATIIESWLSFRAPNRETISNMYKDIEFLGANKDSIYVQFENKSVNNQDIPKFKIKLN